MTVPLLRLSRIAKSFGAVQALRGVSFDLLPGEVHALVGENGAGKSTLVRIMTGADQPDEGSIEVAGCPARGLTPVEARRLGIACVYQEPALCPDLTVCENIALRLRAPRPCHLVDWPGQLAQARRLLERIGSDIAPNALGEALSMPEQQLVEIACVLGAGSRIILMDEPTASLTDREVNLLFKVVRDLCAGGAGVVYISHRLHEVFSLAERVTVLRDGESVGTRAIGAARPPEEQPLPRAEIMSSAPPELERKSNAADSVAPLFTQSELIRMMIGREILSSGRNPVGQPGEVMLEVKDLGCGFGGVRGITFDVRSGEILGLAGLVGAGRSELARVLFGLTPADTGEIRLAGRRVEIRSPEQAIGLGIAYVPEDRRRHGVILEMSVAANMTMGVHQRLFPGAWLRLGAERALALDFMRRLSIRAQGPEAPVSSLSGGNQQKVALARWLATRPKLLILDEPTQGVDVGAKSEIHELIRRLASEGLAVLMISSDLSEVMEMSDRIVVMRQGRLTALMSARSDPHAVMAAAFGHGEAGEKPVST